MIIDKNLVSGVGVVLAICSLSAARPNQNEMLVKSASAFAQDTSKLPWSAPGGGVMYLPEINAFLVPAESLVQATASRPHFALVAPQMPLPQTLSAVQPPRRRRPIANFIKYINENIPNAQISSGKYASTEKKGTKDDIVTDDKLTEMNVNKFYGPGVSYYSSISPQLPIYSDLDRTLSENDQLLEKMSEDLDETTMILMGQGGHGTRLTLRPVAKAVAGPRGVAVASPIAQAVLRRKDPAPEISYEPDSVAVAGPGGQAYSHPKLIVTYLDEANSTSSAVSKEVISQPSGVILEDMNQEGVEVPSKLQP